MSNIFTNTSDITNNDHFEGYNFFKDSHYYVIWAAGTLSCVLSLMGSCVILYLIWKRKKIDELYHRLVLGLSISDLISTIGLTIQPYMLPQDTGYPFAIGNQTTCTIVGILHPFYIASYCHNSALAIYFMMMIRYNKKEKDIQRFLEPWCYILAFGFPLVYTIVCATLGLFNPNPFMGLCNAFPYPADCTFIDDVECVRGEEAGLIVPIHDSTTLIFVITGMVCTWMVFSTIRQRGQAMARYTFAGQVNEQQYQRQRDVSIQAVYYTIAYLIGFVTVIITEVLKAVYKPQLETIGDMVNFPFYVAPTFFIWLLFPLQGILNCIIYVRPRYNRWRRLDTEKSVWWVLRMVLTGQSPPTGRSNFTTAHFTRSNHHTARKSYLTSKNDSSRKDVSFGHDSKLPSSREGNDESESEAALNMSMSLRLDSTYTTSQVVGEGNESQAEFGINMTSVRFDSTAVPEEGDGEVQAEMDFGTPLD